MKLPNTIDELKDLLWRAKGEGMNQGIKAGLKEGRSHSETAPDTVKSLDAISIRLKDLRDKISCKLILAGIGVIVAISSLIFIIYFVNRFEQNIINEVVAQITTNYEIE